MAAVWETAPPHLFLWRGEHHATMGSARHQRNNEILQKMQH
jgi:hypothetical protein